MFKAASKIVCRAMNSTACAPGIEIKTAQVIPPKPYFDAVGYLTTPVTISGGHDNINAVLVGTSIDDIIVSCRRTLAPGVSFPSVLDWIQDIFLSTPRSVDGLPGKVHSEFYMAIKSILETLLKEIRIQFKAAKPGAIHNWAQQGRWYGKYSSYGTKQLFRLTLSQSLYICLTKIR